MNQGAGRQGKEAKQKAEPKSRMGKWMRKHPKQALLVLNLSGLFLLLAGFEILLRIWGLAPGYLDMGWDDFRPVPNGEELQVSYEFYTDENGIFKAHPDSFYDWENHKINSWGFRGPEFDLNDTVRKRIMLIGDSFTWGATAKPIDSSYADLIRRPGLQVFNFGIPGADPDQYALLAKHYLPKVKPDLVCLFFYMGNDVMMQRQIQRPHHNRYHITQVGWLNPFLDGDYIGDAHETYAYYLKRFNLPKTNLFNRICASTCIGTRLWQFMVRMGWLSDERPPEVAERLASFAKGSENGPYSGEYLRQVQAVCDSAKVPMRLFIMADHNDIRLPEKADSAGLFQGLDYFYPEDIVLSDYKGRPDGHYNNSGHKKLSKHVLRYIEEMLPGSTQ